MEELKRLRDKIDEVDEQILRSLNERVRICKLISSAKQEMGLPVRDAAREKEVYRRVSERAAEFGLDSHQVEAVYHEIVNMCSSVQE
jgi:chorismate mutase